MSEFILCVNKGFYINSKGEKIELNQNSLSVVFKSDHDQALAEKDKELNKLKAEFKQLEEVFRHQCEELREVVKTFDDVAHVGRRLSWSLVNEYKKAKVEIEELRKQRNGNVKDRLEAIDGDEFIESYLKDLDAEIEAKKAEVT